jgi:hypothetical protein
MSALVLNNTNNNWFAARKVDCNNPSEALKTMRNCSEYKVPWVERLGE